MRKYNGAAICNYLIFLRDMVKKAVLVFVLALVHFSGAFALAPGGPTFGQSASLLIPCDFGNVLHVDPIHKINFRYPDEKRGFKPFIAPTVLISAGAALHFSTGAKADFQGWFREKSTYSGHADDYIQYAPLVAVYSLNALGLSGKNNFGNRSALAIKGLLLTDLMVNNLKNWSNSQRPNGDPRSFPSGHTSVAFALAHFMHKEYGEISPWYSIGAYGCATAVGVMRVAKNAHWASDVLAGAGFGMLAMELSYLTHLYKWDKEHIRNFDIFPFKIGNKKGLALVYRF